MAKSKYELKVQPYLDKILYLRRNGMKLEDIAKELGVGKVTLNEYRKKHEELDHVLQEAQLDLDKAISNLAENSLKLKMEDRFITEVEERDVIDKDGGIITLTIKRTKFVPADTTALIFALKNRLPDKWNKDEHTLVTERAKKIKKEVEAMDNGTDIGSILKAKLDEYS